MNCKRIAMCVLLSGLAFGAQASDYGCQVLLCLANPAGPKAVAECVPPITRLFRDMARGRSFPTCDLASAPNGPTGRSWAQYGTSFYDLCPSGTTTLDAGALAVRSGATSRPVTGVGEGDGSTTKVCVGNLIGSVDVIVGEGESEAVISAGVYDRIVSVAPTAQPHYADVYVDSRFSHRVRW